MPRAPGGCRTPRPPCRRGCSAMCAGLRVADLCAAPGGKTAQLAAAGARVTAVDRSPARLERLRGNLARLVAHRRARLRRRRRMDRPSRSTPCCSTRRAPRPARSAAIPTCPGSSSRPISPRSPALQRRLHRTRRHADQAGRHARLLHLLARAGGRRGRRSTTSWRARPAGGACRSRRPRLAGRAEFITTRRRSAHPAVPSARCRSAAVRASTASTPRGSKSGDIPP